MPAAVQHWLSNTRPPKVLWRTTAALVLGGQVIIRILRGACLLPPQRGLEKIANIM